MGVSAYATDQREKIIGNDPSFNDTPLCLNRDFYYRMLSRKIEYDRFWFLSRTAGRLVSPYLATVFLFC